MFLYLSSSCTTSFGTKGDIYVQRFLWICAIYRLHCALQEIDCSPVILWEKRGLPETKCNKRYFYRILIRIFL